MHPVGLRRTARALARVAPPCESSLRICSASRLAPAALATAALTGAAITPAAIAAPSHPVARIVAPRAGALITGDSVRTVITVRSAPKGFRAELDDRRRIDVTGRFRRTRHGELTATLRVGRQLAVGENHLFVVVPRRVGSPVVTSAHFVVARPRGG